MIQLLQSLFSGHLMLKKGATKWCFLNPYHYLLTLLHSERLKLYGVLAILSANRVRMSPSQLKIYLFRVHHTSKNHRNKISDIMSTNKMLSIMFPLFLFDVQIYKLWNEYRKSSKIWDTSNNCHNCPKNRKV